ncbi:unnamed protein product [Caenorhabditis auriculariae]|uniref:Copper homeostasis protein cutC homolog n=1 Tax=Caenorhabditis auriculariae TaxID=2777116 RepID=A0A8S1GY06_9PELO|nr:unnamed protein product [Caenorhabditis auriculariae]
MKVNLEICIDSFESAVNAVEGDCDRLEVCSSLDFGGLTPSIGLLLRLKTNFPTIPLMVMLRPRPGNFVYTTDESLVILEDLKWLKKAGADGFVFGALTKAFDLCPDWQGAIADAVSLGFRTILTSGQKYTALLGAENLKQICAEAKGRIDIMAGSGVNSSNLAEIIQKTGCDWYHGSASVIIHEEKNAISMGSSKASSRRVTSAEEVRKMKSL